MSNTTSQEWIIPADIPFAELKARDLEECVYWLLDAMGARDLEWRTGGTGEGAPDGGRDLEAAFYVPSPDGEMEPQRWWVECKGRKGTVEPDQVKSAVNNAAAASDLAYLVIVTNTTFSNPTRDWVKSWQATRPRPRIKLWDHETLERLLSRHPTVVLRLFSEALSPVGLLKFAQQRFWDKLEYTPVRALATFWSSRAELEIEEAERVALIANEFGQGSIADRPWAAHADLRQLGTSLQLALINLPYLRMRAHKVGIDEEPIFAAIAHMILVMLQRVGSGELATLVLQATSAREGVAIPDEVLEMLLLPVLGRLAGEMQDVCASDCDRVFASDASTLLNPDDPVEVYWRRFDPAGRLNDGDERRSLVLERASVPCKVGFEVGENCGCPLFGLEPTIKNIPQFLAVIERVSRYRNAEAEAKMISKTTQDKHVPIAAATAVVPKATPSTRKRKS